MIGINSGKNNKMIPAPPPHNSGAGDDTESMIERFCNVADYIMIQYGYSGRVAGGYLAAAALLLTLHDTTFPSGAAIKALAAAFQCEVKTTVGAIILNSPRLTAEYGAGLLAGDNNIIEGEYEPIDPPAPFDRPGLPYSKTLTVKVLP